MIPDYDACLRQLQQRRKQHWTKLSKYGWLSRYDAVWDGIRDPASRLKFISEAAIKNEYYKCLWAAYIADRLKRLVK